MNGLPKKYARLGFKKGWAAFKKFRGSKGAFNTLRLPSKKKKTSAVTVHKRGAPQMARHSKKGSRVAALRSKASRALSKARNSGVFKNHADAAIAIGLGAAAGIGTSFAVGAIPLPASLPKPAAIKSALQAGLGVVLAMQKNKYLKYAGYGAAVLGVVGIARDLFNVPSFAGEVDEALYGELLEGDEEFMGSDGQWMGDPMAGDPLAGESMGSYSPF